MPVVHGLVLSHVRFGASLYGKARTTKKSKKIGLMSGIQTIINDTMRTVASKKRSDKISIDTLSSITGIPTLNQIIVEDSLMQVWRSRRYELPLTTERTFFTSERRATRQGMRGLAVIPTVKSGDRENHLQTKLCQVWNAAPDDFRSEEHEIKAKKRARTYAQKILLK